MALDFFSREFISGVVWGGYTTGFDIIFHKWLRDETESDLIRSFPPDSCDAAILYGIRDSQLSLIKRLSEADIPHVTTFAIVPGETEPWVAGDDREAVARIVRHLADLGHRRIACLRGPTDLSDYRERCQGYLDEMAALGLPVEEWMVVHTGFDYLMPPSKDEIRPLLDRPDRPTAVICDGDETGPTVLQVAWELGIKVPQDLAVVALDDTDEAATAVPALTVMRQSIHRIAAQAVHLAACAVLGQEPVTGSWQRTFANSLVIRQSCGSKLAAREEMEMPGEAHPARQLEARIQQLEVLNEDLRDCLSVVSHDLRAPLVTINGFTEMLESKCGQLLDQRGRDYVARIQHSARSLGTLMDALLYVSRRHQEPLDLAWTDAGTIVEDALHDLETLVIQTGAKITVGLDIPTVFADPVRMREVFTNLLANALNHTRGKPQPEIRVGCMLKAREYEFYVQDNGSGIDPEQHSRIFKPFARASGDETEGTGVGLAIVKHIVLAHGGRVWVESQPGSGATFRFTLPRRENDNEHTAGPERAATA